MSNFSRFRRQVNNKKDEDNYIDPVVQRLRDKASSDFKPKLTEEERKLRAGEVQNSVGDTIGGWFNINKKDKEEEKKNLILGKESILTDTMVNTLGDSLTRIKDAASTTFSDAPASEKIGKNISAATGIVNFLFSPMSGAFLAAEEIPVIGGGVKAVSWTLEKATQVAGAITNFAIDHAIGLSDEAKKNLKAPVAEVAGLATQLFVFKKAADVLGSAKTRVLNKGKVDLTLEDVGRSLQKDPTLSKKIDTAVKTLMKDPEFKNAGAIEQSKILKEGDVSVTNKLRGKPEIKFDKGFKEMKPEVLDLNKKVENKPVEKTEPIKSINELKRGDVIKNPEMELVVESTRPITTKTGIQKVARVFEKNNPEIFEVIIDQLEGFKKVVGKSEKIPQELLPKSEQINTNTDVKKVDNKPKSNTIVEKSNIKSKEGDRTVAAQVNTKTGEIKVDPVKMQSDFENKAWTKPKIEGVKALSKDQFKTVNDYKDFLIKHEKAHLKFPRKSGETIANYENRINDSILKSETINKIGDKTSKSDIIKKNIADKKIKIKENQEIKKKEIAAKIKENQPGFFKRIKIAMNPGKYIDNVVSKKIVEDFVKENNISGELAAKKSSPLLELTGKVAKLDKIKGEGLIHQLQAGVVNAKTQVMIDFFKEARATAKELLGTDIKFRKNYLPQYYADSLKAIERIFSKELEKRGMSPESAKAYMNGGLILNEATASRLKVKPTFDYQRVFDTYRDAERAGLTMEYSSPADLGKHYYEDLYRNVAARKMIDELKINGDIIDPKSGIPEGYKPFNKEFIREVSKSGEVTTLYGPADVVKTINGLFGKENPMLSGSAFFSNMLQEFALSAGFPGTTFNYFSLHYVAKMAKAGHLKEGLTAFTRANFSGSSMEWFLKEIHQNSAIRMAELSNRTSLRLMSGDSFYDTHLNIPKSSSKISRTAQWGYNLYNDLAVKKTFGSAIPQAHIMMWEKMRDVYHKSGKSLATSEKMAMDHIDTLFDTSVTKTIGRSKNIDNLITSTFLAPKFRESLVGGLINMSKSLTKSSEKGGVRTAVSRKFARHVIATYTTVTALNKVLTGHWMWENTEDQKHKLEIPISKDKSVFVDPMPAMWYIPRSVVDSGVNLVKGNPKEAIKDIGSLASIPVSTATDLISNKDYFGRPIWVGKDEATSKMAENTGLEKAGSLVSYAFGSFMHPYISEPWKMWLKHEDPIQGIANIFEFPLKVRTVESMNWTKAYSAKDEISARLAQIMPEYRYDLIAKKVEELSNEQQREFFISLMNRTYDKKTGFLEDEMPVTDKALNEIIDSAEPIIDKKDVWPSHTQLHDDNIMYGKNWLEKLGLYLEAAKADPKNTIKALIRLDDDVIDGSARSRREMIRDIRYSPNHKWWHIGQDIVVFEREAKLSLYSNKKTGNTQVDHKISIWMGGDNQKENLDGKISTADKKKKDFIEEYLRMQWQTGKMNIHEVRKAVGKWPKIYDSLSDDEKNDITDWHDLNI